MWRVLFSQTIFLLHRPKKTHNSFKYLEISKTFWKTNLLKSCFPKIYFRVINKNQKNIANTLRKFHYLKLYFNITNIVYYTTREVKSWPVQSTCKLRAEGEGGKHVLWGGPLYPHVAYTIFHQTRAENTAFAFRSRERKWHFRPGYGEKILLLCCILLYW